MVTKEACFFQQAFARLELLVLLAVLGLLAVLTLPTLAASRSRSNMIQCQNNLCKIGEGFQLWANDNGDLFPWVVAYNAGNPPAEVSRYFLVASNEFGSPRLMVCPSDSRARVNSWNSFENRFLSYFAGLHGDVVKGRSLLSGDRNISGIEGVTCALYPAQICTVIQNAGYGSTWSEVVHVRAGNLVFSDGSTAQVSNRELPEYMRKSLLQEWNGLMHILKP